MPMMKTAGLGFITYVVIAVFAFGSLLKPVFLVTLWSDRLEQISISLNRWGIPKPADF